MKHSEQGTTKDQLSPLKISRRVKQGCCYRYARGPRRGRMCGEEVARVSASDFCAEHALKILSNQVELEQKRKRLAETLCPHGMPLADNICGPCSEGRPNRVEP